MRGTLVDILMERVQHGLSPFQLVKLGAVMVNGRICSNTSRPMFVGDKVMVIEGRYRKSFRIA
jgi:hypothetical protein